MGNVIKSFTDVVGGKDGRGKGLVYYTQEDAEKQQATRPGAYLTDFPAPGVEVDENRMQELAGSDNKQGTPLIEWEPAPPADEKGEAAKPPAKATNTKKAGDKAEAAKADKKDDK